jgi:hypothetical protein
MRFGRLDQILQPSIRCNRKNPEFAGPHRYTKFRCLAGHLRHFGDALVANVTVNHLLITMQQLSCRGEVMHVGSGDHDRVDQT